MKSTSRSGKAAFTLIELMAVITIIVILAGLVVAGMGFVNERQAKEKAKVQIALISRALEEYKLDNGTYPGTINSADGIGQSAELFKALYYNPLQAIKAGGADKIYVADLDPISSRQGWTTGVASATTKILDPWGNEYRYRSAFSIPVGTAAPTANSNTQNPDFDLWSSGKDGRSSPTTATNKTNNDDIKNF